MPKLAMIEQHMQRYLSNTAWAADRVGRGRRAEPFRAPPDRIEPHTTRHCGTASTSLVNQ